MDILGAIIQPTTIPLSYLQIGSLTYKQQQQKTH